MFFKFCTIYSKLKKTLSVSHSIKLCLSLIPVLDLLLHSSSPIMLQNPKLDSMLKLDNVLNIISCMLWIIISWQVLDFELKLMTSNWKVNCKVELTLQFDFELLLLIMR
jgi:hypothetical protein